MIIIHHNDLDGRMAAAVTRNHMNLYAKQHAFDHLIENEEYRIKYALPTNVRNYKDDSFSCEFPTIVIYHEYYYNNKFCDILNNDYIKSKTKLENETVFIVDCSITEESAKEIMMLLNVVKQVVLIDHHQSSMDYYLSCDLDNEKFNNSIFKRDNFFWYITNIYSGALLCDAALNPILYEGYRYRFNCVDLDMSDFNHIRHVYSYMKYEDKYKDEADVENYEVAKYPANRAILLTDDYDRWIHKFADSNYLNSGARLESNKIYETYLKLLTDEDYLDSVINAGKIISDYIDKEAFTNRSRCHVENVFGIPTLCLNSKGNSKCFVEEEFNKYDMVCLYYFNGYSNVWTYSFYSKLQGSGVCHKVAKRFGGGGHPGAAGCSSTVHLFSEEGRKLIQGTIDK